MPRTNGRALLLVGVVVASLVMTVGFLTREVWDGCEDDDSRATQDEEMSAKAGKSPETQSRAEKAEKAEERRIIDEWGDLESRRLFIFGSRGELLPEGIKALKLTEPEQAALNDAVGRLRQKTVEDFLSRTRLEEKEEKADGTHYHFYARARSDFGRELLDPLAQEFGGILGPERAKAVLRGLQDLELPGEMGRYDMEIEVIREAESTRVKYRQLSAKTGETSSAGEYGSIERLKMKFGDGFELPLD